MPNEPQVLERTQRERVPPDTEVLAMGPGKYRIEYARYFATEPHRFEAEDDRAALRYVATYLRIDYPLILRQFRGKGARGVYCEGQHEAIYR